jgi:hypothetical protein
MFDSASSFSALVGIAVDVVILFMALLSFVESAPEPIGSRSATPLLQFQHQAGRFRIIDQRVELSSPPMSLSDSYRARPIECMEAADAIAVLERKVVLLELAQRWLDLASRIDTTGLRGDVLLQQPKWTSH